MSMISITLLGQSDSIYEQMIESDLPAGKYIYQKIDFFSNLIRVPFKSEIGKITIFQINRELDADVLLHEVLDDSCSNPVIVISNDFQLCIEALDIGCFGVVHEDELAKSLKPLLDRIIFATELIESRALLNKNKRNITEIEDPNYKDAKIEYVCASDCTKKLLEDAEAFAKTDEHILITGPTGTGKEALGKFIHNKSNRKEKPYQNVNLGATSKELIASTLFGYVKGAFTNATKDHSGIVEKCDGGTLVLDEFGDISPEVQIMLLRLLENGEYHMVGDNRHNKVDVRIIATTKYPLDELKKRIRNDLFYRLLLKLKVSPLEERRQDLAFLINEFLSKANEKYNRNCTLGFASNRMLLSYNYPGNIRELRSIIYEAVLKSVNNTIQSEEIKNIMT